MYKRQPIRIPNSPKNIARNIIIKRHHLRALIISIDEKASPDIADIDITIIIIGEIIPAATAASPNIKPPSIDTDVPILDGFLISLSLSISNDILINKASSKAEKGTLLLCSAKMCIRDRLVSMALY